LIKARGEVRGHTLYPGRFHFPYCDDDRALKGIDQRSGRFFGQNRIQLPAAIAFFILLVTLHRLLGTTSPFLSLMRSNCLLVRRENIHPQPAAARNSQEHKKKGQRNNQEGLSNAVSHTLKISLIRYIVNGTNRYSYSCSPRHWHCGPESTSHLKS